MRTMSLLPVLLCACASRPPVEDGETIELLESENRVSELPAAGDPVAFESGFDVSRLLFWTHVRGVIEAEPAAVWAALQDPDVMADRRVRTDWEVTEEDHIPNVDFSLALKNEMSVEFANIEFELTWIHQQVEADDAGPSLVLARWDKTGGPPFIDVLSGTLEIERLEPGVSEIRGISHLRSVRRDAGAMEQYWTDLHAELSAVTAGDPLPEYDPPGLP